MRAEAAHSVAARQALDVARTTLKRSRRRAQRIETEVRTLSKLLDVHNQQLFPPVVDLIQVEKAMKPRLGAAIGDDIDAPIDERAPIAGQAR